jgi:hypothetical protein
MLLTTFPRLFYMLVLWACIKILRAVGTYGKLLSYFRSKAKCDLYQTPFHFHIQTTIIVSFHDGIFPWEFQVTITTYVANLKIRSVTNPLLT